MKWIIWRSDSRLGPLYDKPASRQVGDAGETLRPGGKTDSIGPSTYRWRVTRPQWIVKRRVNLSVGLAKWPNDPHPLLSKRSSRCWGLRKASLSMSQKKRVFGGICGLVVPVE